MWKIEIAEDVLSDLALIHDHLVESYVGFGEAAEDAMSRAQERLMQIRARFDDLARLPFRGTLREEFGPGVRFLTMDRSVLWFEVIEATRTVRILAVFFGSQNHIRHMYRRLLSQNVDDIRT
ncbi:MAG: type II toxin-antitoxin system RelE/ParE family toxin [Geminicoccaceae bacterium]|nr:type II toxin-antitoxin system RelE/ParE family toxin [Geminicoccaceae bacterium]